MCIKKILIVLISIIQIGFGATLPTLSGKTLANTQVNIPNDTQSMVLIIGFDMKSAEPMAEWVRQLILTPSSNLVWYQVAVIGKVPPFVDGFIKKGMKKSVSKINHDHYFPYFGGKKKKLIQALVGSDQLENSVTPFIAFITKKGELAFVLQAEVNTKNAQIVQSKLIQLSKQ